MAASACPSLELSLVGLSGMERKVSSPHPYKWCCLSLHFKLEERSKQLEALSVGELNSQPWVFGSNQAVRVSLSAAGQREENLPITGELAEIPQQPGLCLLIFRSMIS